MSNFTRTMVYLSEGNANGAQSGVTLLTPTRHTEGIQFHPLEVFIKVINAQNIDTAAVINIGTNSPNYNNIVSGQSVNGPARTFPVTALAQLQQLPVDADININVVTPATGTNPTLTFRAGIIGVEV